MRGVWRYLSRHLGKVVLIILTAVVTLLVGEMFPDIANPILRGSITICPADTVTASYFKGNDTWISCTRIDTDHRELFGLQEKTYLATGHYEISLVWKLGEEVLPFPNELYRISLGGRSISTVTLGRWDSDELTLEIKVSQDSLRVVVFPFYGIGEGALHTAGAITELVIDEVLLRINRGALLKILKSDISVTSAKQARSIGKALGAHLAVWGRVIVLGDSAETKGYLTNISDLGTAVLVGGEIEVMKFAFSEPSQFSIYRNYTKGVSDLATIVAGKAFYQNRQYNQAIRTFEAIATSVLEANLHASIIYMELEQYDKAIAALHRVLTRDSLYPGVNTNLGILYTRIGQFDRAIQSYRREERGKPDREKLYYNWGTTLLLSNQTKEAIEKYDQVLQLNSVSIPTLTNLAVAYEHIGNYKESLERFKEATVLDPANYVAYYGWGLLLFNIGKPLEAIDKYERAVKANPAYSKAYNNWGYTLSTLLRFEEAVEKYELAIACNPRNSTAYGNWGDILLMYGDREGATLKYAQAIDADRGRPEPWFNAAQVYFQSEEYDKAIEHYRGLLTWAKGRNELLDRLAESGIQTSLERMAKPTH